MGADASMKINLQSKSKSISFEYSGRTKYLVNSSPKRVADAFYRLGLKLSEEKACLWKLESYFDEDYEGSYRAFYLFEKGRTTEEEEHHHYPDDNDQTLMQIIESDYSPEWFEKPESNNDLQENEDLGLLEGSGINWVSLSGFLEEERLEIAKILFEELSPEYIRLSKEEVLTEEGVALIECLPEHIQRDVFGVEPPFKNLSHALFTWDATKLRFEMHPELVAVFADSRNAISAYNRGEWALFETREGLHFYESWRGTTKEYMVFKRMGGQPIEGKATEVNPVFAKAQEAFAKDALSYMDGNAQQFVGAQQEYVRRKHQTFFTYKLVLDEQTGIYKKVNFYTEEYYPLVSLRRYILKDGDVYDGKAGDSKLMPDLEVSPYRPFRWVAKIEDKVIFDQVVKGSHN